MYCKKCGNPVGETDVWCSACGTRLKDPSLDRKIPDREEAPNASADGNKSDRHTEFNWNVHDFSAPKRPEELRMRWTLPQSPELAQTAVQPEQLEERSAESPAFSPASAVSDIAPEKVAEAKAAREESVKANEKFFTFTKRNEEFQRLLDQEYERLKGSTEGEGRSVSAPASAYTFTSTSAPASAGSFSYGADSNADKFEPAAKPTAEDFAMAAEDFASIEEKPPVTAAEPKELAASDQGSAGTDKKAEEPPVLELLRHNRATETEIKIEAETKTEAEPAAAANEQAGTNLKTDPETDPVVRQLSELRKTTESFYQQLIEEKEALKNAEKEAARRAEIEQELARLQARDKNRQAGAAVSGREADGVDTEIKVTVAVKSNGKTTYAETVPTEIRPAGTMPINTVPDESFTYGEALPPNMTKAEPEQEAEPASVPSDTIRIEKYEEQEKQESVAAQTDSAPQSTSQTDGVSESLSQEGGGQKEAASPAAEEGWHENTLNNFFAPEHLQEEREEADKPQKSGVAGKVILAVIAIILAVEIIALGIRYFAPESGAAAAVENAQMQIVRMIDAAVDYFKGLV